MTHRAAPFNLANVDTKPNSLGKFRERLEMPRPEFARLLGVSVSSIREIERGRLPLSQKLAWRAWQVFGVSPESLYTSEPLYGGHPYQKFCYRQWKVEKTFFEGELQRRNLRSFMGMVEEALEVARKDGVAFEAFLRLGKCVAETLEDLGIDSIESKCRIRNAASILKEHPALMPF